MASKDDYDPDSDLAALRPDASARLAVASLFAIAVTELGTYLQVSSAEGATWVLAWVHGKLLLIAAAVFAALDLGKMRPRASWLHPAVAVIVALESVGWLVFSFGAGYFSLFALLVVPASLLCLALLPGARRTLMRADAARERLAQNGIDDPFA